MERKERIFTPAGIVTVVFSDAGLKGILLPSRPPPALPCSGEVYRDGECGLAHLLVLYLSGVPVDFSQVELDMGGLTPFTCLVLDALKGVGYGERITYGQLADRIGKPGAFRAVGQALRRNPFPLVVPCHRVVARDGIGGFSGGIEWKRWLLAMESGV